MEPRTFHILPPAHRPDGYSFKLTSELSDDLKSTQSTAHLKQSGEPEDECDTDESVEANVIRSIKLCPSRRKAVKPDLLKKSFKQELEKLGATAKQLLDKNPTKLSPSRTQSPERDSDEKVLLPFQRRARSNSPVREDLNMTKRQNFALFPAQGPVKANKPVVKKVGNADLFSGFQPESSGADAVVDDDDELETLKREYSKLLDFAMTSQSSEENAPIEESKKDVPKASSKKSKITFM